MPEAEQSMILPPLPLSPAMRPAGPFRTGAAQGALHPAVADGAEVVAHQAAAEDAVVRVLVQVSVLGGQHHGQVLNGAEVHRKQGVGVDEGGAVGLVGVELEAEIVDGVAVAVKGAAQGDAQVVIHVVVDDDGLFQGNIRPQAEAVGDAHLVTGQVVTGLGDVGVGGLQVLGGVDHPGVGRRTAAGETGVLRAQSGGRGQGEHERQGEQRGEQGREQVPASVHNRFLTFLFLSGFPSRWQDGTTGGRRTQASRISGTMFYSSSRTFQIKTGESPLRGRKSDFRTFLHKS